MSNTVNLIYGPHDYFLEDLKLTVGEWVAAFSDVLSLGENVIPFLNGQRANLTDAVGSGDRLELIKRRGKKGCDVLSKREFCLRYFVSEEEWEACLKAGLPVTLHQGVPVILPDKGIEALQRVRQSSKFIPALAKASVAGLHIDEPAFSIHFEEKTCLLGNSKQFKLFGILARNVGTHVSHDALVRLIWEDFVPESNTINKLASRLQESLNEAGMSALVIDGRSARGHYILCVRK